MCHYPPCQNKAINDPDRTSKTFPTELQRVRREVFSQSSQLCSTILCQKHSLRKQSIYNLAQSRSQIETHFYQERAKICPVHHQFVLSLINSVSSEAFKIKRFSEKKKKKTFHRYSSCAKKKKCLMTNLFFLYYCLF